MKYVAIMLVLLVLAGAGYAYVARVKSANASAASVPDTRTVVRRTLEKLIAANGKVASNRDVDIKCQASGKIINLPVDISDHVKLGDLLMELDPVDQKRSLDQAKAQVDASQAHLAQTKTNYDVAVLNVETSKQRAQADLALAKVKSEDAGRKLARIQELFNSKLASQEDLENAQTVKSQADAVVLTATAALAENDQQRVSLEAKKQDIASAQAQLAQDQARYDLQDQQFKYTKVYVPDDELSKNADYRVSKLTVQVGTVVQSGSSGLNGGTTVMTLSDLSHIYVLASVDESDIGQVIDPQMNKIKQKVHITVDSYPGRQFEGEVVRVASVGVNTSNVVTFEVKIEVTSDNKMFLRPEMTATVKIVQDSRPDALVIPAQAFVKAQPADSNAEQNLRPATAPADVSNGAVASAPAGAAATRGRGGRNRQPNDPNKVVPQEGTVTVMDGGVQKTRDVTVGLNDGESYEVLSGLSEGEDVVVYKGSNDSKWRGQGTQTQGLPRVGIGGGSRGR